MTQTQLTRVFAVSRYQYLRDLICEATPFEKGELSNELFPNGDPNRHIVWEDEGKQDRVVLIGSTDEADFLELWDFARELTALTDRLELVIPFMRSSRQELKKFPGHVSAALNRMEMLAALPKPAHGIRLTLMDLHAPLEKYTIAVQGQEGFEVRELRSGVELGNAMRSIADGLDFTVASADCGRHEWVKQQAKLLGVQPTLMRMQRVSATEKEVLGEIDGDVSGKLVFIFEDMICTGGTALESARRYLDAGARSVWLVAAHADFGSDVYTRLRSSGLLSGIITSNSWDGVANIEDPFLVKVNLSSLLARELV